MHRLNYAGRTLLSFLTFNLGWWACALGPRYGWEWIGPASMPIWVGLHLYFSPTRAGEALFLATLGVLGFAIDTGLIYLGFFQIVPAVTLTPVWLVCMWILLGLTFESMLIMRRNPILICLMGIMSGPLSYLFAQAVNIMIYSEPQWLTMSLHGALWAALMPGLFMIRDYCVHMTLKHKPVH